MKQKSLENLVNKVTAEKFSDMVKDMEIQNQESNSYIEIIRKDP